MMKSTIVIKNKLDQVQNELDRINSLYEIDLEIGDKQFFLKNGHKIENRTFNQALTALVAEKRILQWILS